MIYILLAVSMSVLLLVLFKVFPGKGVHTGAAILYNYLFAFLTGIIFADGEFPQVSLKEYPWQTAALPLGALFITVFHLISLTTQKVSIAAASVANKMSLVMPVLFSVFFLSEKLQWMQYIGILLAIPAVYLSVATGEKEKAHSVLLPFLVFIGSGIIDVCLNAANAWWISDKNESAYFSAFIFASAFLFGTAYTVINSIRNRRMPAEYLSFRNIAAGAMLGIPNYFSIYFIFMALESGILQSASLFPLLNVANVAFSALTGSLLFREKMSKKNIVGLVLAIASVILISL